jgi:hypothetical protein
VYQNCALIMAPAIAFILYNTERCSSFCLQVEQTFAKQRHSPRAQFGEGALGETYGKN